MKYEPRENWVGFDFDGALAFWDGWNDELGAPIPQMVDRVKWHLARGEKVKILTARAEDPAQVTRIEDWCEKHIGVRLEVTQVKDYAMREFYDDRAKQVIPNTGLLLAELPEVQDILLNGLRMRIQPKPSMEGLPCDAPSCVQ